MKKTWIYVLVAVFAFCVVAAVDSAARLQVFYKAIITTTCLMSVLGALQHFFGGPYLNAVDPNAFRKLSVVGGLVRHPVVATLGHPNALAVFLSPSLILSVGWFLSEESDAVGAIQRRMLMVAIWVSLLGLLLTQAKAPIAWTLASLIGVVYAVRRQPAYSSWRAAGLLLLGMVVAVGSIVGFLVAGLALPGGVTAGTLLDRLLLNYQAVEMLRADPFLLAFGGGSDEFAGYGALGLGLHNEYASQVLRYGLPACALFLGLLVASLRGNSPQDWVHCVPLIALAVIFLLESASGSQLQSAVFLALAIANRRALLFRNSPVTQTSSVGDER